MRLGQNREKWNRSQKIAAMALVVAVTSATFAYQNLNRPDATQSGSQIYNGTVIQNFGGPLPDINETSSESSTPKPTPSESGACHESISEGAGWGPGRPVLGSTELSPFPSFNQYSDSVIGDQRGFYSVKDASNKEDGGWKYDMVVHDNTEYLLRIYINNNASSDVSDIAQNTRLMVHLPACNARIIGSNAFVSSSNSYPDEIWGGVNFFSNYTFNLSYVEGSAQLCNNANPCSDGLARIKFDNSFLTSTGVALGFKEMDGNFIGGYKHAAYFTFRVLARTYHNA